jgi:hypothetical protein
MFGKLQKSKRWVMVIGGLAGLAAGGLLLPGQDLFSDFQYPVPHAECVFFGPNHNSLVATGYTGQGRSNVLGTAKAGLTDQVMRQVPDFTPPGASASNSTSRDSKLGLIDKYIFQAMAGAGVTPAGPTTDYEFIRRASLDLTGRIPTADAVLAFVNSADPNKRATLWRLIPEQLANLPDQAFSAGRTSVLHLHQDFFTERQTI